MSDDASQTPTMSNVWIIVPAYNEASRLPETLKQLVTTDHSIAVIDDGSSDETADVVRSFPVWLVQHPVNCGQGAAIQTGLDFARRQGADVIVTFDGDGQHSVADIPMLVAPVASGEADVALGSRFLGTEAIDMPPTRRLTLKLAVWFTRFVSRIRLTDTHNGLRAFSRSAAEAIQIRQNRMAHASEILDEIGRLKLRFIEVPVTVTYRAETLEKGQSGWAAIRISADFLLSRILK